MNPGNMRRILLIVIGIIVGLLAVFFTYFGEDLQTAKSFDTMPAHFITLMTRCRL
jgi:hypothetical protein